MASLLTIDTQPWYGLISTNKYDYWNNYYHQVENAVRHFIFLFKVPSLSIVRCIYSILTFPNESIKHHSNVHFASTKSKWIQWQPTYPKLTKMICDVSQTEMEMWKDFDSRKHTFTHAHLLLRFISKQNTFYSFFCIIK